MAVQQDMGYGMAVDGVPWYQTYGNKTNSTLSADGTKTAVRVHVANFAEGEIYTFQDGAFTASLSGPSCLGDEVCQFECLQNNLAYPPISRRISEPSYLINYFTTLLIFNSLLCILSSNYGH